MNNNSIREAVCKYVKNKYDTESEYLWIRYPNYAVFRHSDNKKWYAITMNLPKSKIGLSGEGNADILNVKLEDLLLHDVLIRQKGYLPGYHMNKGSWVSILLDGTVPFEEICSMIDKSYTATASKKHKEKIRPPKEWLIPANPKYYDIEHTFDNADEINWKQGRGIKAGDTVYLYAAAPISAVLYKCVVTETDIIYNYQDENLTIRKCMKIKLLHRYKPTKFTFKVLKNDYGIFAVRGPRSVPDTLSNDLKL